MHFLRFSIDLSNGVKSECCQKNLILACLNEKRKLMVNVDKLKKI
jgi:hypothetical protein